MNNQKIRKQLDDALQRFHRKDYLSSDPLQFVHLYDQPKDQEVVALIASSFAFGNVKSINPTLQKIFHSLGSQVFDFLKHSKQKDIQQIFQSTYYRFYTSRDIQFFFCSLASFLNQYGSLGDYFGSRYQRKKEVDQSLKDLFEAILPLSSRQSYGLRYFLSDPVNGTAKRARLFLRWLVRKDEMDLGLWNFIPKNKLIIPLDTHLFQVCRDLHLHQRKTLNRRTAIEVTNHLIEFDPEDPLRYDFALCRVGMFRKEKTS